MSSERDDTGHDITGHDITGHDEAARGCPELPAPDLLSQREACELLRSRARIDRETARRVLKAGLAGEPVRLRGTLLHRRELVEAVAERPLLGPWLPEICRQGTFVARLAPRRAVPGGGATGQEWRGADVLAPPAEQLAAAGGPWRLSALARVKLRVMVESRGFLPFVATVGGYVVLGAEVVDVAPLPGGRARQEPALLALRPPGDWFEAWRRGRLPTAAGGPWQMWPAGLWELASTP